MNDRIRPKKTIYETDGPSTIEFFKLNAFDDMQDDLSDGNVWVYEATLLSNVKFELDDPFTRGQLVSYVETETTVKLAGGQAINSSTAIVIGELLHAGWYITRELVVPDAPV